ncbi:MAG: ABC transporter substrate-binding protein [Fidelibacterota bacterium]
MKKIFILLLSVAMITGCGKKSKTQGPVISLFQFASRQTVDDAARGVLDGLKEAGYVDGENCEITIKNAQNDFSTAQLIAQKLANSNSDIIITLTTPCLQVMANTNKRIPHVFGMVTDPFRMGVADDPDNHIPNITGVATFQPVESAVKIIKEIMPDIQKLGVVWNPTEACSEACTEIMRSSTKELRVELLEITVTNSIEVQVATQSVIGNGAEAILVGGDNTVELAIDALIQEGKKENIPIFTTNPPQAEKGALMSIGADYYTVGIVTGELAARVLKGEKPADIPIQKAVPEKLWVNKSVAKRLNIQLPETLLNRSDKILGEQQ